jgi:hypothetical protein
VMGLEVLVVLEVQRGQRQIVSDGAGDDPHVVDWAGASTLDACG